MVMRGFELVTIEKQTQNLVNWTTFQDYTAFLFLYMCARKSNLLLNNLNFVALSYKETLSQLILLITIFYLFLCFKNVFEKKNCYIFLCFKLIFFIFLDHFNALISKLIFKKYILF